MILAIILELGYSVPPYLLASNERKKKKKEKKKEDPTGAITVALTWFLDSNILISQFLIFFCFLLFHRYLNYKPSIVLMLTFFYFFSNHV